MPQAQITINAVIGSDLDLPINTLVQLDNNNIGGEVSYLWEIVDQPAGAADVLSSPTIQNPTFTPQKEGTYLVRLTVNQSLPSEDIDTVVAAVLLLKTRQRVPAAGEQNEASTSRGWAIDVNEELRVLNDAISDPSTVVGSNLDASPLTRGDVVRATGVTTIKSGLPGEEKVPGFTPAPSTVGTNLDELLMVVEGDVDGNTTVGVGALGVFRYIGRFATLPLGAGAVGDVVFVDDSAVISLTQGTVRRQVGTIMAIDGANRDIWFAGTQGGGNAPIDPKYVLYGAPGTLPNANRVDGLNATGAINNIPYTFKAADVTTVALVAKRFSAGGAAPFQVHDESGSVLASVNAAGDLDALDSTLRGGLRVGFSGTPTADRVEIGDANAYVELATDVFFNFDSGPDRMFYDRGANQFVWEVGGTEHVRFDFDSSNPQILWESTNDRLRYDRTNSRLAMLIANTQEWQVDAAAGVNIRLGLVVGTNAVTPTTGNAIVTGGMDLGFSSSTPVADTLRIGDTNFLARLTGGNSNLIFDHAAASQDQLLYNRSTNSLGFEIGGSAVWDCDANAFSFPGVTAIQRYAGANATRDGSTDPGADGYRYGTGGAALQTVIQASSPDATIAGDIMLFEKTDTTQADPNGQTIFGNTGNDGVIEPALIIDGDGLITPGFNTQDLGTTAARFNSIFGGRFIPQSAAQDPTDSDPHEIHRVCTIVAQAWLDSSGNLITTNSSPHWNISSTQRNGVGSYQVDHTVARSASGGMGYGNSNTNSVHVSVNPVAGTARDFRDTRNLLVAGAPLIDADNMGVIYGAA